jgi:putative transposase
VVQAAIAEHGILQYIRSDNGPEFIAYALKDWMDKNEIRTIYITPGSPWEQAWIESFHDKLRDELLNREWFATLR